MARKAASLRRNISITTATGSYQVRELYCSKFPWFSGIYKYEPAGFSNYLAMEVRLMQRTFHGRTMKMNYSFGKDLATTIGGNNPFVQDGRNDAAYYGPSPPTHHFGRTASYAIPGMKSFVQLLQGFLSKNRKTIRLYVLNQQWSPTNFGPTDYKVFAFGRRSRSEILRVTTSTST